jgi:hypothetical protein
MILPLRLAPPVRDLSADKSRKKYKKGTLNENHKYQIARDPITAVDTVTVNESLASRNGRGLTVGSSQSQYRFGGRIRTLLLFDTVDVVFVLLLDMLMNVEVMMMMIL